MAGRDHEGQEAGGELAALRAEVARLAARVEALESAGHAGPATTAAAAAPPQGASAGIEGGAGIPEETLLVIVAAVSAFLGKRPRLRAIQLLDSAAWSRAGRVSIQASHALSHHARTGGSP